MDYNTLPTRIKIRALRSLLKIPQWKLAKDLDIYPSRLAEMENGFRDAPGTLEKALGLLEEKANTNGTK